MGLPATGELMLSLVPHTQCVAKVRVRRDGAIGWWLRFTGIDGPLDEFLFDFERLRPVLQISFLSRVMSPEIRLRSLPR